MYYYTNTPKHKPPRGPLRNDTPITSARQTQAPRTPTTRTQFERRERDFGVGYGSSSGYASAGRSSYVRGWRPGVFKFG